MKDFTNEWLFLTFVLSGLITTSHGQTDFLWLTYEDSARVGIVREFYAQEEGSGVEFRPLQGEKKWTRFHFKRVHEYSTKKDTFRVFTDIQLLPRKVYQLDYVKAKYVCRGAINLFALISEYSISSGFMGPSDPILVLEESATGHQGVLSSGETLLDVLSEFLPQEEITDFLQRSGKSFKYRDLKTLVCNYNRKRSK